MCVILEGDESLVKMYCKVSMLFKEGHPAVKKS